MDVNIVLIPDEDVYTNNKKYWDMEIQISDSNWSLNVRIEEPYLTSLDKWLLIAKGLENVRLGNGMAFEDEYYILECQYTGQGDGMRIISKVKSDILSDKLQIAITQAIDLGYHFETQ